MTKELPQVFKTWLQNHTDSPSINNSRAIARKKLSDWYSRFQNGHNKRWSDEIEIYTNQVGNGDMIICDVSNLDPVG